MRKITILFVALIGISNSIAAQEWEWVFSTQSVISRSGSNIIPTSVGSDAEGNIYMNCYSSHSSINFGNQTFENNPYTLRNFFVKFNNAGSIQWIKDTPPNESIIINSTAVDATGNIYSCGEFMGSFNYEGYTFDSENALFNAFVYKTDSDGTTQWAKHISVEGDITNDDAYINRYIRAYDIVTDIYGNTYLCGQMNGVSGIFDSITVPIQGENDDFIAKYDANGNVIWVKTIIEGGYQSSRSLASDSLGNVYITGSYAGGTITFDDVVLGPGMSLTFLAKYSPEGDVLWVKSHGGSLTNDIYCSTIAIDANDNIYIAGYLNFTSITFDNILLTSNNTANRDFLVKYNSSGVVTWVKSSDSNGQITDIKTGSDESVYVVGNFSSPQIVLGETTLTNEGVNNGYITKMDISGNSLWAEQIGSSNNYVSYLDINQANNSLYVGGGYTNARFGDQTYSNTASEVFLSKYNIINLETNGFNAPKQILYPNPAKNFLNISDTIYTTAYVISDTSGKTILQGNISGNNIDVSTLSAGLYFLKFNSKYSKFIKE